MVQIIQVIFLLLTILLEISQAGWRDRKKEPEEEPCGSDLWPIYAGRQAEEATTSCMVHDLIHGFVIVGGTSTEAVTADLPKRTGFVYALNYHGDWMWSRTFYHGTERLHTVG